MRQFRILNFMAELETIFSSLKLILSTVPFLFVKEITKLH